MDLLEPLCCRYAVLQVASFGLGTPESGTFATDATVHHALGVLANGTSEFVGIWLEVRPMHQDWDVVMEQLRERGVERIRYVVGPDAIAAAASRQFGAEADLSQASRRTQQAIATAGKLSAMIDEWLRQAAASASNVIPRIPKRLRPSTSSEWAQASSSARNTGYALERASRDWATCRSRQPLPYLPPADIGLPHA